MAKIQAFYTLEVKDKKGKTVSKVTKLCKSFTLQFLQLIEAQMMPSASVTAVKETGGVNKACREYDVTLESEGGAGDDTLGILVGTGTTPVTNADYVMETLIDHGVVAGDLSYGSMSKVTTGVVGANVDLQIIRAFTNSSGGTISVTEIGIYSVFYDGSVNWDALTLHEIVASTDVLNTQTLTVTITLRTTV